MAKVDLEALKKLWSTKAARYWMFYALLLQVLFIFGYVDWLGAGVGLLAVFIGGVLNAQSLREKNVI